MLTKTGLVLLGICGVIAAALAVYRLRPSEAPFHPARVDPPGEQVRTDGSDARTPAAVTLVSSTAAQAAALHDLAETSWQNPFDAAYWESQRWTFDQTAMRSGSGRPAIATFRRTYRELSLDLQFDPEGAAAEFEIRLATPATACSISLTLAGDRVVVTVDTPTRRGVVNRKRMPTALSENSPVRLRLGATGNRLRLAVGGRPVLTCDQPPRQSGREMTVTLISRGPGLKITALRFEGR